MAAEVRRLWGSVQAQRETWRRLDAERLHAARMHELENALSAIDVKMRRDSRLALVAGVVGAVAVAGAGVPGVLVLAGT